MSRVADVATGRPFDGLCHHGSLSAFTAFGVDLERGVFFSTDRAYAAGYGPHLYTARVVLQKPVVFTELQSQGNMEIDRLVLIAQGFDGRIVRYNSGHLDVVAFFPEQVTLVDHVCAGARVA